MAPPVIADAPTAPGRAQARLGCDATALLERLDRALGQSWVVVDLETAELGRVTPDWPRVDLFGWLPLLERVSAHRRPEPIEDHAPLLLVAVPLPESERGARHVAAAVVSTDRVASLDDMQSAARVFGVDPAQALAWARSRPVWPAHAALHTIEAVVEAHEARSALVAQKTQLADVSSHLLATFEELNLLHRLTGGLSVGHGSRELCTQAVQWLAEVTPADAIVAHWIDPEMAPSDEGEPTSGTLLSGRRVVTDEQVAMLAEHLGAEGRRRALVLNRNRTSSPTWPLPEVREVVSAPITAEGEHVGWILAINYRPKPRSTENEFGSVEASLVTSVASLLGVHHGNRRLLRQRTELFESSVQAITRALDAKDAYTCGHSDRVARIAVRLARELGLPADELSTLYLAGLLHDVGKIGIDDEVLRKPDRLTPEEYEHIKTHPVLGERILAGVEQLAPVLPIVRHHHEAWDGSGYPDGLAGDQTPLPARIVAVADSLDAMRSDRPYRRGMDLDRVEQILREGAGRQWDPAVIDAYFAARDEIAAIGRIEREPLDLDVRRWRDG